MYKPLPLIEIQKVIHYAMPLIETAGKVGRHTLCGISTMIPGRRVKHKGNTLGCKTCKAVEAQVRNHTRTRVKKDAS